MYLENCLNLCSHRWLWQQSKAISLPKELMQGSNFVYMLTKSNLNHLQGITQEGTLNLGQKVGDKFTQLSKIGFSMECFTAEFLRFFTKKGQNLALG